MRSLTRIASRLPAFLLVALFLALAPNALAQTTWYVDGVNGSDNNNCRTLATACKTIGHAISLSASGDTIKVAPATYTENLNINLSLSIIGSGAATTIVDGGGVNTVVTINPTANVVLGKLTIRNGYNQLFPAGGILNWETLTIDQSTITSNSATYGGGIANYGALTVNRSTISGNNLSYEYGYGGGVYSDGVLTVNQSTITSNSASSGGGIEVDTGTATISNSTFGGNSAPWGGGITIASGVATITNSTFSGNSATDGGGGIDNYGTLTINNVTITGNSAPVGGGILQSTYGSAIFQNSIIANNPGGNCSGTVTSDGYNLSSDGSCSFNGLGDLNNTDPRLGTLGNYGGPTQTIIEMLASPTVDAGNPNGCTDSQGNLLTTDQRGAPRPGLHKSDKRCDMGAFERQTD